MRAAARQLLVDIQFEPPNRVCINRARFLKNGVEIIVWPESVLVVNKPTLFSECHWNDVNVAVNIGDKIEGASVGIHIPEVPRYLGDRTEAIRWATEVDWT